MGAVRMRLGMILSGLLTVLGAGAVMAQPYGAGPMFQGGPAGGAPGGAPGGAQDPATQPPPLDNYSFSAFDERFEDYDPGDFIPNTVSIDFLYLIPKFQRGDIAFSTNFPVPGGAGAGDVPFEYNFQFTPRVNVHLMPFDIWGVRGSWWRYQNNPDGFQFDNIDPRLRIASPQPFNNRVLAPRPFFFLNRLSSTSIVDGAVLPAFPATDAVRAGGTDTYTIQNQFHMNVADVEFTRYVELGSLIGTMNFGARYATFVHKYSAARFNSGRTSQTVGYDYFNTLDDDGGFGLNYDYEEVQYTNIFVGAGPKSSFELSWDLNDQLRIFSTVSGSTLVGRRTERESYRTGTSARIFDIDGNVTQGELSFNRDIRSSIEKHNTAIVSVGELEAGVGYRFGTGTIWPYLKVSGVVQYWMDAGSATDAKADLLIYGLNATLGFGW